MRKQSSINRFWGVPPWIFLAAVGILFPIFAVMTFENIHRQKENASRLLLEKGAALIRSFEAGARTGMGRRILRGFTLQNLLSETALQPDIAYLMVTDAQGTILSHSQMDRIGQHRETGMDLDAIADSDEVRGRIQKLSDGKTIFEVFRRFTPSRRPPAGRFRNLQDPSALHWHERQNLIIFVGLDMGPIEAARRADTLHTLIMGSILLLIGFAGIFLLFLAQSYRATRQQLSRVQTFSDTIVEKMPAGLLAIDEQERIVSLNPAAARILNLSCEAAAGKQARDLLPEELRGFITDCRTAVEKEIECCPADRPVPLQVSVSALRDENERLLGHILLLKDLSEIRTLRSQIVRNQRMATVGSLAAGVAHEIRNPLSSIKGFATYFRERYQSVPDDQKIADIMIQEVDRLNRVVGQLLDFSRPLSLSRKPVHIRNLISDSLALVRQKAEEKNIAISMDVVPENITARIDPDQIRQVLLNLHLNALEAMDSGSRLSVSAKKDSNMLQIRIQDTGCGILPEHLSRIFDPYFTTRSSGAGLGLAIVHNIIEAHEGRIEVESRPGEGTAITLHLPDSEEEAAR
ncbi:MAG: ATP-binding protein [Desulfobacterales bacterium]|jgi:two-component system sensor histidine kinase HydH|nr:ATP-binding protein [Desulfobacterales bacterium]MDD3950761.1 ATP-binding protein [Desulfobacterales bacterium]MDY0378581.1 ATP-binding protein [Desulfobacterales bacterium]